MKRFIWVIVAIMLGISGGLALADTAYEVDTGSDSKAFHMGWDTINSAGVTNAIRNPNLYTNHILCTFVNSGSDADGVFSLNLQTSRTSTGTFANVLTTVHDFDTMDTDTYEIWGDIKGGPYWLWNTSDAQITFANRVSFECDFWK